MSDYDKAISDIKIYSVLAYDRTTHIHNLIAQAQSKADMDRILNQMQVLQVDIKNIEGIIVKYRVHDSPDLLYLIRHNIEHDLKPGLRRLQFNAAFTASKAAIDEWGPRIDTMLGIIEKVINIVKTSKKRD